MMKLKSLILLLLSLLNFCLLVQAQQTREEFGRNRIQYRQYKWQYVSSENFDLYYYDEKKKLATQVIQYLEGEFSGIIDLIGHVPYAKTKIFLYASVADLQQSNVGLNYTQTDMGGKTEFIKPHIEIAHMGSTDELKDNLIYKTAELMTNEMMFGGNLKDMFKNAVLLNLPDWTVSGLSRYVAKGWDADMDDYIRQLFYAHKSKRIAQFKGQDAMLVGQSIWNYIAEKYGRSSISSILNYTRVIRNIRRSIAVMLGIGFRQLISDWYQYYATMGEEIKQYYISPEDSTRVSRKHGRSIVYTAVKINPDGMKLAYTENDRGRFVIKIKSLENKGEITVLSGGNRVFGQEVDYNVPLVGWVNSSTLGVIGIRRGGYVFWLYDLATKSKLSRKLNQFDNIRSLSFSSNGRLAVLSADRAGQNDIFLISTRRDRTRRLTNDAYDDIDASFLPNSQNIIFSSNRTTDTINTVVKNIQDIPDNYNLYAFDLDTTTNVVSRITNAIGKNYRPQAYDQNTIYYLSDLMGIVNIFQYSLLTKVYSQVTYFNSGIKVYDLDFRNNHLAIIMRKKLKNDIFVIPNFDHTSRTFRPNTQRILIQQAKMLAKKRNKQQQQQHLSVKDLINFRLDRVLGEDSTSLPAGSIATRDSAQQAQYDSANAANRNAAKDKTVDTKDYTFEDELLQTDTTPSETFLSRYAKAKEKAKIKGPFSYKPLFIFKNFVTNFMMDPITNFGMRIETQMNDVFENYRFFGGVQFSFDGESGSLYAEAQYLPYRVDYSARIEHTAMLQQGTYNSQKYTWQKIEIGASLPFSVRWRIAAKPFIGYVGYIDRGLHQFPLPAPPVLLPGEQQFYAGAKVELVYDNSLTTGLNIIEGTRGKINFIQYASLENEALSFSHVFADIRHYQKIYKSIVLAIKGYIGTFFGNSPKKYVLGGMDNWIFNQTNRVGSRNPLSRTEGFNYDLIFTEFATNMRGFKYATLYGNSVILSNIELRVPLIRVLSTNPISSNFLRNMQFIAFYDIGTSWMGPIGNLSDSPATRTVPEKVTGNPFRAEIVDFLNPWIYSYGIGLRAKMLGFYTKFDLAWPVQNYTVGQPQFYFTLGFDF